ncbi:MAG TPA: ankyrin repeat domain-containing protein [Spirochaetota bacterium]|nr:ankyrin repeat domain-containing protein [Spirochaetota bacterium]HPU89901.1 ankyrin repeat domain-containing protein [Spirochaetota bacterium]
MTGTLPRLITIVCALFALSALAPAPASAKSIIDESAFGQKGADVFLYVDMKALSRYLGANGITMTEIFRGMQKGEAASTDAYDELFNLVLGEITEIMVVGTSAKVESGSGVLVFIGMPKYRKEIDASLAKRPRQSVHGYTLYEFDKQKNVFLARVAGMMVIGFKPSLAAYLGAKKSGTKTTSAARRSFVAGAKGKTFYMYNSVSRYIKKQMEGAMAKGAMMAKGLDANVYVKALLNLRSVETAFTVGSDVSVRAELASRLPADAKRLEMVSHFAIVGASIALSFSGMLPKSAGQQALSADQERIARLQAMFDRIETRRTKTGVAVSYQFTSDDRARLIVAIKEALKRNAEERARLAREKKVAGLFAAIEEGSLERVVSQLAAVGDPNVSHKNSTPLCVAADKGNRQIVEYLISKKADVNGKTADDQLTPLHLAAMRGHTEVVTVLIGAGADINAKSKSNATPLQVALKNGAAGVARVLLQKNPDVKNSDEEGETALHLAAAGSETALMKLLMERGADVNALSKKGDTPLHRAAAAGRLENVKALVEAGANRKATNYDGLTPREEALKNNHQQVADFLGN